MSQLYKKQVLTVRGDAGQVRVCRFLFDSTLQRSAAYLITDLPPITLVTEQFTSGDALFLCGTNTPRILSRMKYPRQMNIHQNVFLIVHDIVRCSDCTAQL